MRVAALIESAVMRFSRQPFLVRRFLVRALFDALKPFGLFHRPESESLRLAGLLRIPVEAARRIWAESAFHDLLFALEWAALLNRPVAGLLREMKHVRVENEDLWHWAAASPSVILATLHSGCYQVSIAYLCARYFPGRKVVLIRNLDEDENENRAIERLGELGIEIAIFRRADQESFIDLFRLVRRGAVLFMLVDLPGSYGRPVAAELFSWEVELASGVVDIALLCKAPILFYTVTSTRARDVIAGHELVIPQIPGEAERRRIVGKVAGLVTREVGRHPEQWHMWDRFAEYRPVPRAAAT